jgi:DNA processing protein
VLPSPVTSIYPASNRGLAADIVSKEGLLVSEYGSDDRSAAFKSRFIERNRLVSGLADISW